MPRASELASHLATETPQLWLNVCLGELVVRPPSCAHHAGAAGEALPDSLNPW